ncbi:non-canonical purine NTP pyrophosphatase [Putridiphycobacter roseus]|uniref:dITP/XTP pyrophosphatase n=1 Tax=Putridiphycobacter roseus TaxID=2219161 RepID=A0A2W1MYN7_9FLAO|nr:non-canonical purine NTP diphosphatase [Putridiphycobacter roseus]PZE16987.1 non-canonical purine NTP pyrophosphatase [Putridiphycobacter roseus]
MKIVFATNNQNKVREIQKLLPKNITVVSLKEIDCNTDIPETAPDLKGNASLKSSFVYHTFHLNCFADDTGLEIEALNGEPGVRSARYADAKEKSDEKNMALVLEKLKHETNRNARFKTVISLQLNGTEYFFEGVVNGTIAKFKMGEEGFGYDPIFVPNGFAKSFAQMSMTEKNNISHRGQAVQKLIDFLNQTIKA